MNAVHFVVPDGIDDTELPSGGNVYDRRVCGGLAELGWTVHEHRAAAPPTQNARARTGLASILSGIPDNAVVLVDGLIAFAMPESLIAVTDRLRLTILVHMLDGVDCDGRPVGAPDQARELAVLSAADAVVATSRWTRARLIDHYGLPAERVHVAEPGASAAAPSPGTAAGGELLCVAAVVPRKGHDVMLAALAKVADLPWRLTVVGSLRRDAAFVDSLRTQVCADGIDDRVSFVGPRAGADLDRTYAAADLLVLASHAETYGMVVTEALARGLPVLATDVGGVPEALGHTDDGRRPGLLIPPGDVDVFAAAIRDWLGNTQLRQRLRAAASDRRGILTGWATTAGRISDVLAGVSA